MRLIGVVIGAEDSKTRFNQMASLFSFGFNNFENKVILSCQVPIYVAKVKNSKLSSVDLYPKYDFVKFMRKGEDFDYSLNYKVNNLKAPIEENQEVGCVYVIDNNNMVIDQIPLVVKQHIKPIKIKDILRKIYTNIQ